MRLTGSDTTAVRLSSVRAYRPDIQGLRALAVLLVLAYHSGVKPISGGFIGVDVFFVISGFFITGLLARELQQTNSLSLLGFYARRVRRLVPASVLVVVVTLIVAKVIMPPLQLPAVAHDSIASSLDVVNMWLGYNGTDYLGDQTPSLFQHYWSLAVEEQFYLVWPVVLLMVARSGRYRGHRLLLWTMGLTIASLLLCIWMTVDHGGWAYLLLPTRAWELGAGAILALSGSALARVPDSYRAIIGWTGLLVIVSSALLIDALTRFPGWVAVIPVSGAAAVIASGGVVTGPAVLLNLPPMQFLGRISYSLYLWHWPILLMPTLVLVRPLGVAETCLALLTSVLLSWLTFKYVEEPFRKSRTLTNRRPRTFVSGAVMVVVAVAIALFAARLPQLSTDVDSAPPSFATLASGSDFPGFVPRNVSPALQNAGDDLPPVYANGCEASMSVSVTAQCVSGDESSSVTVVLFGDSRASQWFSAVDGWALDNGLRLITMTKSGCPPADIAVRVFQVNRPFPECDAFRADAVARIAAMQPALVVMSGDGDGYRDLWTGAGDYDKGYAAGVAETVDALGGRVVVLGDTPTWQQDPAVCLSANLQSTGRCTIRRSVAVDLDVEAATAKAVESKSAMFVQPSKWLCSETCNPLAGNVLLYRDSLHIGDLAARILQPKVAQTLDAELSRQEAVQ